MPEGSMPMESHFICLLFDLSQTFFSETGCGTERMSPLSESESSTSDICLPHWQCQWNCHWGTGTVLLWLCCGPLALALWPADEIFIF